MRNLALAFGLASVLASTASADEPAPTDSSAPADRPAPAAEPSAPKPAEPASTEATPLPRPPRSFLIPRPTQGPFAGITIDDQPRGSRTPAIIATTATGALLLASIVAWYHYDRVLTDTADAGGLGVPGQMRGNVQDMLDRTQRAKHLALGVFATALVGCGVTGYMWSRLEHVPTMTIEPTNQSIRVAYVTSF